MKGCNNKPLLRRESNPSSMKINPYIFLLLLFSSTIFGQTTISGVVTDKKGNLIIGANIYLEGTYDGSSSDKNGGFSFTTLEKGTHTLIASYISYESFRLTEDVSKMQQLNLVLRDDVNSLETVSLSAGTFSTIDNSKVSVLLPIDIVTTPGAVGDFVGALLTLPGTSTVAEDGRLFVRGGDAEETQIFIDGIRVFTPYTSSANNIPVRGRYSPFLFDGITFSTGGYSAEYGQALSSILLLNTKEEEFVQEKSDITIMSLGAGLGHTKKWVSNSLSLNSSYINLAPYKAVFPDKNQWVKPYESIGAEAVFRQKIGGGLLKLYSAFESANFELDQENIDSLENTRVKLDNQNFYTNASFSETLNHGWSVFVGGSYTYARTKMKVDNVHVKDLEHSTHLKLKLTKRFNNYFKLHMGAEHFMTVFDEDYYSEPYEGNLKFNNRITATFAEGDVLFSRRLALKLGIRQEYSELQNQNTFSPRASLAFKTSESGQFSLAYGDFFQQQNNEVLKFKSELNTQHAQHYILNYQYAANNRIFRAELFRKNYYQLTTYSDTNPNLNTSFFTDGNGYAQGLDVFWRDNQSVKSLEYWVSYSYLDTERFYNNYPETATPSFVNRHNLSVVTKYWIDDLKSQVGLGYQFASGRSFTDYNKLGFLQNKTKSHNNISFNWAYLLSPQKILYVSISNVFGFKNVNGYEYASTLNSNGIYSRRELRPAMDRFFFIGFFWTISRDGKANQLDNL